MAYENIITHSEGAIMRITINRPNQLNALNGNTIAELSKAFKEGEANTAIRAII